MTTGAPSAAVPGLRRNMVTICAMTATIMQALDTTIANVALPHMQASLGATQESINWVLTSYIVASAIALWKAKSDKPTPLVVFIHGGGFHAGGKEGVPPMLVAGLLEKGVSIMSISPVVEV